MKQRVMIDGVNGDARPKRYSFANTARLAHQGRYQKTAAGKATKRRYQQSPKGKTIDRKTHVKRKFGISLEEYDRLRSLATHCPICGVELANPDSRGSRPANVKVLDHNHATGVIRGIICCNCNKVLGLMKDNTEAILKLAEWAKR